jgi:hypothetical protein
VEKDVGWRLNAIILTNAKQQFVSLQGLTQHNAMLYNEAELNDGRNVATICNYQSYPYVALVSD